LTGEVMRETRESLNVELVVFLILGVDIEDGVLEDIEEEVEVDAV
jgi:hypothetical protein